MAEKEFFPIARAEADKMKKQLKFNDWLLSGEGLKNAREWVRPVGPGDTVHRRGGVVERFNQLKMQRGGAVKKKDSDDGDEELPPGLINMPIGEKGTLSVTPEYTPSEGVGITGRYEHQFSPQTTGGVEGYAYKYHDDPKIDAGGRLYMRHKFQQGGAVEGQSCKHGSSTIVSCRNKNE